MLVFEVITIFLVAVAMSMALAQALEYPGKMRLSRESYFATQSIFIRDSPLEALAKCLQWSRRSRRARLAEESDMVLKEV